MFVIGVYNLFAGVKLRNTHDQSFTSIVMKDYKKRVTILN